VIINSIIDWSKLPAPQEDGACDHVVGMRIPALSLVATSGDVLELQELLSGVAVLFFYPMTADRDGAVPHGWDEIPGARGCTPQICSYRDSFTRFKELGVQVYGVSTQDTEYQREMKERTNVPFECVSDEALQLTRAFMLPTLIVNGSEINKRLTLIIKDGIIIQCFYPVFPPEMNADNVYRFLSNLNKQSCFVPIQ